MEINRKNCEQWMLDYFDGKLGPVETAALMLFLEQHDDLRTCFEEYGSDVQLPPEKAVFAGRHALKRRIVPEGDFITEKNFAGVFFEDAEGLLNPVQQEQLRNFLKHNPSLVREWNSWRKARLIPEALVYPAKADLKRNQVWLRSLSDQMRLFNRPVRYAMSAAAVLIVLLLSVFLIQWLPENPNPEALGFARPATTPAFRIHVNEEPGNRKHEPMQALQAAMSYPGQGPEAEAPRRYEQNALPQRVNLAMVALQPRPVGELSAQNESPELQEVKGEYTRIMEWTELRQQREQQTMARGNEPAVPGEESNRVTFWDLARLGVRGYNAVSGQPVEYRRTLNVQGQTTAISLGSFAWER